MGSVTILFLVVVAMTVYVIFTMPDDTGSSSSPDDPKLPDYYCECGGKLVMFSHVKVKPPKFYTPYVDSILGLEPAGYINGWKCKSCGRTYTEIEPFMFGKRKLQQ